MSSIRKLEGNWLDIIFMLGANNFAIIEDIKRFIFRLDAKNETVTRLNQLIIEVAVIQCWESLE